MKKILIIFMVVFIVGTVGGVMYTTIAKLDAAEEAKNEYASTNPFPYEMPDVIMYPNLGCFMF